MDKNKIDWGSIQKAHDSGMTWRSIQKSFGITYHLLAWAKENKLLSFRSLSDAAKLSWKLGIQKAEIYKTPEFRKKQSRFGGNKPNSGRCKHIKYQCRNGKIVDIQGTWELKLVEFLDKKNIKWERNKIGYKYHFNEKDRSYFPDFWLPKLKVYIEVKGYETEKDRAKWNQFPFKLIVIKKQEIQDLTAWWNRLKLYEQ